jgi:hypothetical protein
MSSNILHEIKNVCLHTKNTLQPIIVKPIQLTNTSQDVEKNVESILIKNKLITCYEEDYTRNSNEIMRLWQRN